MLRRLKRLTLVLALLFLFGPHEQLNAQGERCFPKLAIVCIRTLQRFGKGMAHYQSSGFLFPQLRTNVQAIRTRR